MLIKLLSSNPMAQIYKSSTPTKFFNFVIFGNLLFIIHYDLPYLMFFEDLQYLNFQISFWDF